jgi:cytochrome c biogenesis protein CcmG/thiol:disulfide interchange protein DsbE
VFFAPVALVLGFAAIAYSMMTSGKDNSVLPSALIGALAPELSLPPLDGAVNNGKPMPALTSDAIRGQLTLVNVWASWCVPCRQEHPIIMGLSKDSRIKVVGINYKDKNENALGFLAELGNPFAAIGVDPRGAAAIDWGVYGIPESYLVGADGKIIYKRVGPFDEKSLNNDLFPAIEKALAAAKS